ncbi:MAG: hypothetical protein D6743_07495, partial [Calditrichaeota bacterium]
MASTTEQLREEQSQIILQRFEARSRSFRRLVAGLVGFALAYFFIVLFPYVSIQFEKQRTASRLQSLPR